MSSNGLNTVSKKNGEKRQLLPISKHIHDFICHYSVTQQFRWEQMRGVRAFFNKANISIITRYHNSFQLMNRLKGAALCDIKTRFTTKKRNPE